MPSPPTLEKLAQKWCAKSGLPDPAGRSSERVFLANVQTGKPTQLSKTANIRGELIRFLCGNEDAQDFIDPCGIVIEGGIITGETVSNYSEPALLLSSLEIPFPLIFHKCTLPAWVLLQGAEIPFLDLDGCEVSSIAADVLKIRGDLHMRNRFRSNGNLNFSGATIGGDLDLSGAELKLPTTKPLDPRRRNATLSAEGIHVSGDIRMTDYSDQAKRAAADSATNTATGSDPNGAIPPAPNSNANPDAEILHFQSTGTIDLDGAHIDGEITCDGGTFGDDSSGDTELHDAVTLRHAFIGGDVLMGRGFIAKGAVRLPGAIIGGDLDCGRGHFYNPWFKGKPLSGVALELDGTEIKLDASLSYGRDRVPVAATNTGVATNANSVFRSDGTVSLRGTRVGRTLHCATGYFHNSSFDIDPTNPHHRWRPALDLRNCRVAYLSYSHRSKKDDPHLDTGQLLLDGFVYDRISRGTKNWDECIEWIDRQSPKDLSEFAPQPYVHLAKVLRDEGDSRGARNVLYEMEKRRSRLVRHDLWRDLRHDLRKAFSRNPASNTSQPQAGPDASTETSRHFFRQIASYLGRMRSAVWLVVKRFTIGYGYYSQWALLWLAGICLFGALVFHVARGYMVPSDKNTYEAVETPPGKPLPGNYVAFNPFLYSIENTLPIIKLGQTDHWEPRPRQLSPFPENFGEAFDWLFSPYEVAGFLGVLRACQIAAGWFLTTIGVAGLTGIIRKD